MSTLLSRVIAALKPVQSCRQFVLGYSGGIDSTALLHILHQHVPDALQAVHVHHNLSPNADAWQQQCKALCHSLGIPFTAIHVDATPTPGQSPEAAARQARYQALADIVGPQGCLLTAHNQDDQAETVLLQCLRGAGPKGLAAMPVVTSFAKGYHARPLLDVSRAQLQQYVEAHDLPCITDESNHSRAFDRNRLRLDVMPVLKQRWSQASQTLSRVAQHCAEADALLAELGAADCECAAGAVSGTLRIDVLATLSPARQRNALRSWLQAQGFTMPSTAVMAQIQSQMFTAAHDRQPQLRLPTLELRRFQNQLYAMVPLAPHDASQVVEWQTDEALTLPGGIGILTRNQLKSVLVPKTVQVRFRQGGEQGRLLGHCETQTLKKLFQRWGVPPWQRDRIPLIYSDHQLIEVVGYGVFYINSDQQKTPSKQRSLDAFAELSESD